MTDTSSSGLVVTIRNEVIQIGEKPVNLYGILSYLEEDWPDSLVLTTFNLSEAELSAILEFAETHTELAEQIADRQQDDFNQRLLTALRGTYRVSKREYALIAVMPVLGSIFLGIGIASSRTSHIQDVSVAIGMGVFCLVMGMLALYIGYKTRYTFDGNTITYRRIFFAKTGWSIHYTSIDTVRLKRSQHWEYLQITTNDGQEHTVRCIDTIKAVIDDLPEPDKYLI
jgi:hypothetical protein